MPEGPEVTTIAKDLKTLLLNNIVLGIKLTKDNYQPLISNVPYSIFKKAILSQQIIKIYRKGKSIIIGLENGSYISLQLKMTGQIFVSDTKPPYNRITFILKASDPMHMADKRTFGKIKFFNNKESLNKEFKNLGIDVVSKNFTKKYLLKILNSKKAIHTLLLDQTKISGLGNIYSNEALFLAKIKPNRIANTLSSNEITNLYESIKKVYKDGLKHKGTSFSDYVLPTGIKGTHQNYLQVFKRDQLPCLNCKSLIIRDKIAGRSVFYCLRCQS